MDIHVRITVRQADGQEASADVTIRQAAAPPIIDGVVADPTEVPSTGGAVLITVAAHSPSGQVLTMDALADRGTVEPVDGRPDQFRLVIPSA